MVISGVAAADNFDILQPANLSPPMISKVRKLIFWVIHASQCWEYNENLGKKDSSDVLFVYLSFEKTRILWKTSFFFIIFWVRGEF